MSKRLILISLLLILVSSQLGYACNGYKGKEPTTDALDVVSDILKAPCKLLETVIGLGGPLTEVLQVPGSVHAGMGKPKTTRAADKKARKKETPGARKEVITDKKRDTPTEPQLEAAPQPTAPPDTETEPPLEKLFQDLDVTPEESTEPPTSTGPEPDAKKSEPKPSAIESGSRTVVPKQSERKKHRRLPYRKPPCWLYWY